MIAIVPPTSCTLRRYRLILNRMVRRRMNGARARRKSGTSGAAKRAHLNSTMTILLWFGEKVRLAQARPGYNRVVHDIAQDCSGAGREPVEACDSRFQLIGLRNEVSALLRAQISLQAYQS
jgi:hypothetical protein